jgi:hypothetical protein
MDKILTCCQIDCVKEAEYEIVWGDKPDEFTHSCSEHLSEMLTDARLHTIVKLG